MNKKLNTLRNESGVVLVAVTCFIALAAILAVGLMTESSSHMKIARHNVMLEQSFYIAEGGAERAVAYIRNGGAVPTNLTGAIGNGTYSVQILATPDTVGTGGVHTVSGSVNINPNSSPNNEFLLMTTDGQAFDKDDLQDPAFQDYFGNAYFMRVKPLGGGSQTIIVDGAPYTLDNNQAYNFTGASFPVALTNDSRNTNGLAMGQWLINLNGSDISFGDDPDLSGGEIVNFSIYSIGTSEGVKRTVLIDGVHQESWAKYALWYNSGPGAIWIVSGEIFNGPVHANTFIYLSGNPIFNALISSARSAWGAGPDAAVFNDGFLLSAPSQSMASVSFNDLYKAADLVVTGQTRINLSGTNMIVANSRSGWTTNTMPIQSNYVVYVTNASTGSDRYDVYVGGTLDGRLSIITDNDIYITNHIIYAAHPTNGSDDALGLIANRDVIISTAAPTNLLLFAHIMAVGSATPSVTDGKFYVQNYASRPFSGPINLYGGIVQFYRGPVGTLGSPGTGYRKNYTFDARFSTQPPPEYPAIINEYTWTGWRER